MTGIALFLFLWWLNMEAGIFLEFCKISTGEALTKNYQNGLNEKQNVFVQQNVFELCHLQDVSHFVQASML